MRFSLFNFHQTLLLRIFRKILELHGPLKILLGYLWLGEKLHAGRNYIWQHFLESICQDFGDYILRDIL